MAENRLFAPLGDDEASPSRLLNPKNGECPEKITIDDTHEKTYAFIKKDEIMTTLTVTEARKQLYTLLDDVSESHVPIQIAGKRNSAVLVAEEDWCAIQETLHLNSIPGMRESIVKGLNTPVKECEKDLDW